MIPGQRATFLKWSQPPIEIDPNVDPHVPQTFRGWDEPARSTHRTGATRQWRMVADDFPCLGPIPITRIRWWGSYKAWEQAQPPARQPVAWHIGFWMNTRSDLTADGVYLERMVWGLEIPHDRVAFRPVGFSRFPQHVAPTCYEYDLVLEPNEWFHQASFQAQAGIFWISITAIYPTDAETVNQWGWQTRAGPWRQGAQQPAIMGDWPTPEMPALFPGRITPVTRTLVCGTDEPYDMAFELLTEQPWIKWDQPRPDLKTWPYAVDRPSTAIEYEKGLIQVQNRAADDWVCRSTDEPVIALSWYGSTIGYGHEACECLQGPSPRRPDSFLISIWTDAPVGAGLTYSNPGLPIWEYKATVYDEVLVGYDKNPEGEPNEPVFRHAVRLPEDRWFRQGTADQVCWLSIVAVYKDPVDRKSCAWGWTDRAHEAGGIATAAEYGGRTDPHWRILRDPLDRGVDLCFTIYTLPLGPIGQ